MYKEKVIERLNNINWKLIKTEGSNDFGDLGYEFLRRLANFYKETSIKPLTPACSNIAWLLGDKQEIDILEYETEQMKEIFYYNSGIKRICMYYIQIAKYAENNKDAEQYIEVYEPLIRLLEKGGSFILNPNGMEIYEAGYFPLRDWYSNFKDKERIDISNI